MLDERVVQITDDAVEGRVPQRADVLHLLRFDAYSAEAAYVCARAREVGMRACGGRGYVYAQIGVDCTPCAKNCRFCSFAAVNVQTTEGGVSDPEVSIGRIVHFAKRFDEAGVPLISLMATAQLDFERYLQMVRAVRASVSDEITIMANAGDLTLEQACALKEAGATAAYHALRLGEGVLTGIEPHERRSTIANLRKAGIPLMTGVEPVWKGVGRLELSERIYEIPEFMPFCIGACNLTPVEGVDLGDLRPALRGLVRYVAAVVRLVCGEAVPVGGIGGVRWVDAGCDPRSRKYGSSDARLRREVSRAKRDLEADGFRM